MSTPATSPQSSPLANLYRRFQIGSAALQSPFLLLVRLYWGWQFSQSGWGRLHHLDTATGFFATLHVPAPGPTVVIISVMELIGGVLLILGLGSRVTGLFLAGDMIGLTSWPLPMPSRPSSPIPASSMAPTRTRSCLPRCLSSSSGPAAFHWITGSGGAANPDIFPTTGRRNPFPHPVV